MKFKENVYLNDIHQKLRDNLSEHIKVIHKTSFFNKNVEWIDVNKSNFIGVRLLMKNDELVIIDNMPGVMERAFFGGYLGYLFFKKEQNKFREAIYNFIADEFCE